MVSKRLRTGIQWNKSLLGKFHSGKESATEAISSSGHDASFSISETIDGA